ncbi:MAG: hypothetical protein E7045_04165 [Lentisphaerae bacterium]|nr:hypothetical protein [Lentisphaerota bacterium]
MISADLKKKISSFFGRKNCAQKEQSPPGTVTPAIISESIPQAVPKTLSVRHPQTPSRAANNRV